MKTRTLNDKQITILKLAYTFRYLTTDNLARHRNITHNSAYSALEILHTNGYLGKLHKKSYRLMNKAARYYLTLQAVSFLKSEVEDISKDLLSSRRRENAKSVEFVDQQVVLHSAYLYLKQKLSSRAVILVATDMNTIEGIIKPLPGLYVRVSPMKHYIVELTDNQHLFLVRKRIRKYIENYESYDWEWEAYPTVYIIRKSKADRTRLNKYIEEKMDNSYLDDEDFKFRTVATVLDL